MSNLIKAKELMLHVLNIAGIEDTPGFTSQYGLHTDVGLLHLSEHGVAYTDAGKTKYLLNQVLTMELVKLITSPIAMDYQIKYSIISILRHAISEQGLVLTLDVEYHIEGDRIMVSHRNEEYRINLVTNNVTKLTDGDWIIQFADITQPTKISELKATLQQVSLLQY